MGLSTVITKKANYLHKLQSGFLYHYTFLILIGTTVLLGIRQFWLIVGNYTDYRVFIIFLLSSLFLIKKQ